MLKTTAKVLARVVYSRVVTRSVYKFQMKTVRRLITSERLLKNFGYTNATRTEFVKAFRERLRERFFLGDLNRKEFYINLMTSLGGFDQIMDDADMVHENKFQTLGSQVYSFTEKIDWHLDFKSGKRWEKKFYPKIDITERGNRSRETGDRKRENGERNTEYPDIKVPWEVSRFHQAIWLGKAYWVSHSEAHVEKFTELVSDWIEKNPVGYGVNWNTPMEVAIRAMNLVVGLLYFTGSNRIDDDFLMKLLSSLFEHGVFIRCHLERSLRNGNHYVSDLVGLVYLGILFYDTKTGKRWVEFARKELEKEILNQTYEDGTDYEKSTSYQRLVTELFTAAYVLLKLNRFGVSDQFTERLERMFRFLASATMRDGRVPCIGDADDGRVFRMKSKLDFNDHRDLLSVGAVLFGSGELKTAASSFSELALLLLGGEGFEKFERIPQDNTLRSEIYREGGFSFMKTERDFCSFDFGDIGKRGRGGHGHNDVLSFTISDRNQFIVDRGTFCYTYNVEMRNRLRSTYSHNTIIVDRTEQADFAGLWSVKKDLTAPDLLDWKSTDEQDVVEAQHHAYERLTQPVIHRRKITFNKRQRTFLIEDNLLGEGTHQIEMMFHFAPELKVTDLGRNFLALEGGEFMLIKFQQPFVLEDWPHSPSYGVMQTGRTARVTQEINLPARIETFIFIISSADDMNHLLNRIQTKGSAD